MPNQNSWIKPILGHIKDLPPQSRLTIIVLIIFQVTATPTAGVLLNSKNYIGGISILLVDLVMFLAVPFAVRLLSLQVAQPLLSSTAPALPQPSLNNYESDDARALRITPRLPIKDQLAQRINKCLRTLCTEVHDALMETQYPIQIKFISSNLYVLDYQDSDEARIGSLFMPRHFRFNMDGRLDSDLRWDLTCGATGLTFQDGNPRVSSREQDGTWPDEHRILSGKELLIDPDLQHLFTVAISVPFGGVEPEVVGVLNLDIRKHKLDQAHLDKLLDLTMLQSQQIAVEISHAKMVKLLLLATEWKEEDSA